VQAGRQSSILISHQHDSETNSSSNITRNIDSSYAAAASVQHSSIQQAIIAQYGVCACFGGTVSASFTFTCNDCFHITYSNLVYPIKWTELAITATMRTQGFVVPGTISLTTATRSPKLANLVKTVVSTLLRPGTVQLTVSDAFCFCSFLDDFRLLCALCVGFSYVVPLHYLILYSTVQRRKEERLQPANQLPPLRHLLPGEIVLLCLLAKSVEVLICFPSIHLCSVLLGQVQCRLLLPPTRYVKKVTLL